MAPSGLQRRIARVAAICLLSVHLAAPRDLVDVETPKIAAATSVGKDENQKLAIPSSLEPRTKHLESFRGHPAFSTLPSARCADREEWQGTCRLWSGKSHNRYLAFNKMPSKEGIGASLTRVAWALSHVISFDLEPVINGPLYAGHGTGDFGDWMGLTHNPLMMMQDPEEFDKATNQNVPFTEGNNDAWFLEQQNRTSVIYIPDTMKVDKMKGWGVPVSPPNPDPRVCQYVRQALRNIYWSVPQYRGRCHGLLPKVHDTPSGAPMSGATAYEREGGRPWVVAVHVRRGDTLKASKISRRVPHAYFQAAVTSVVRAIAANDPGAHVSILVFSESRKKLAGLQLMDEHGKAITWNIQLESCLDAGLVCSQKVHLKTSTFETFDCLAAADVVVGSHSTFSDAAAAVSTNVKVMCREHQNEQDRVTLNSDAAASSGSVSVLEQLQMDTAIANWWYCYNEARHMTGSSVERIAASRFYQTIDEVSSPLP